MNMYIMPVLTENKRLLFFFTACTWLFSGNLQQFLSKDFPFAASFRIKALNIFQLSNSIIINAPGSPRLVFLLLLTRSSSWEVWTWEKGRLYGNMFHLSSSSSSLPPSAWPGPAEETQILCPDEFSCRPAQAPSLQSEYENICFNVTATYRRGNI